MVIRALLTEERKKSVGDKDKLKGTPALAFFGVDL